MPWDMIFSIANLWVMLFWLLLAIGSRSELTGKIILFGGIGLVSLCYAILLPLIMTGIVDPVGGQEGGSFSSLDGVIILLGSKGGATVGWIHYLAFDLFVGLWVARNADERGIGRVIQLPILFFVLMAGPLGLTLYLISREFFTKTAVNATLPH